MATSKTTKRKGSTRGSASTEAEGSADAGALPATQAPKKKPAKGRGKATKAAPKTATKASPQPAPPVKKKRPAAKTKAVEVGAEHLGRREILAALRALKRGDLGVRLREDLDGIDGQIAEAFNGLADTAQTLEQDSVGLQVAVCSEGRTQRRLKRNGSRGGWAAVATSVNSIIDELVAHSARTSDVVQAVRRGDLEQRIDLEGEEYPLRGTFRRQSEALNQMVDQLSVFNEEVTRVAREVGTEGQLGAQAHVPKVSGAWRELTESVNSMAMNLTAQVREIARVTTAVADGDLSKTIEIDVKGEILALKNTINRMVDQLGSFADEVTRVAPRGGHRRSASGARPPCAARRASGASSPRT